MSQTYNELRNLLNIWYDLDRLPDIKPQTVERRQETFQKVVARAQDIYEIGKWKDLVRTLKAQLKGLNSSSQINLIEPCFTAAIQLETKNFDPIRYKRTAVIHVSSLGPFYTVYGRDDVVLGKVGNEKIGVEFHPIIYVSPVDIYTHIYPKIRKQVELAYLGYEYLPFSLLELRIPGLHISGMNDYELAYASIFQSYFVLEDVTSYPMIGDPSYE